MAGNALILPDPTAKQDIFNQYGVHANADELVRAHVASQDPGVAQAQLRQVDEQKTVDLIEELGGLEGVHKELGLPKEHKVLAAAVRGNALSAVVEDEDGRTYKAVGGADDSWEAPKVSAEQQELRAAAEHDRHLAAQVARLRAEASARIEEVVAEIQQESAKAIQAAKEEASELVQKARDEAENDSGSSGSSSRSSSRKRSSSRGSSKRGSSKRGSSKKSGSGSSGSSGGSSSSETGGGTGTDDALGGTRPAAGSGGGVESQQSQS